MANSCAQDALPKGDSTQQSYVPMDADSTEYPSRNHSKHAEKRRMGWINERSRYDRQDLPRRARTYHRHAISNQNRLADYHGRENFVRRNNVRNAVEHFGFSDEPFSRNHADWAERRRMENWMSKRSSYNGQYLPEFNRRDMFSNLNYLDGYYGQRSYSRRNKLYNTVQQGSRTCNGKDIFQSSFRTYDFVECTTSSSSHLVENDKKSFGSYKHGRYALLPAVDDASMGKSFARFMEKKPAVMKTVWERKVKSHCHEVKHSNLAAISDPYLKQMEEKEEKSRLKSEQAVDRSSGCEQKSIEDTLADCNGKMENFSFDVATTKYACLAVLNRKNQIMDASHTSPERSPIAYFRRKLLVLDLNGLLADILFAPPKEYRADTCISRRAIFKRPFCYDFLKFCFERFDVGIWSSRSKKIIDGVVDYLLGDMKHKLLFCWDLSYCTGTGFKTVENKHKEIVFKELRKIWEKHDSNLPCERGDFNESNTLLLDDSPYKALLNPMHTAIFPYSFKFLDVKSDSSLGPEGDLRVYLQDLAAAEDVQKYVEAHPFGQKAIDETSSSWEYYHRVVSSTLVPSMT